MSALRKLRRRLSVEVMTLSDAIELGAESVTEAEREFSRLVVAWRGDECDLELVDRAARAMRAAVAKGYETLAAVLMSHIATCNSAGREGACWHSDLELDELLPNDEALAWLEAALSRTRSKQARLS